MTNVDLDKPVATLKALLIKDFDTYQTLSASRDQKENAAFAVILGAAFMAAVDRHFGGNPSPGDVINFVADARVRYPITGEKVPPQEAEAVIRAVAGEDHLMKTMDGKTIGAAQTAMLFALAQEDYSSAAEVDALLSEASEQAADYFRRAGQ